MNKILRNIFLWLPFVVWTQQKEVLYREYFKDGTVAQEWYLKNNKPYRYWKTFYKDKKEHYQRNYNDNGQITGEGWMLNTLREDFWIEQFGLDKKAEGFYKKGVKNKTWKFYNGKHLDSVGSFKDGNKIKEWLYYNHNRIVKKENYDSPNKFYLYTYHDNGNIRTQGAYINHQKDGYWEFYSNDNILLTSGYYKNGLKDGYWHFYSIKGELLQEGNFNEDRKSKWWSFFNQKGILSKKCELKNGELDGFCIHYRDDKIVKGDFFKEGVKKNEWTDWKSFKKDYKQLNE